MVGAKRGSHRARGKSGVGGGHTNGNSSAPQQAVDESNGTAPNASNQPLRARNEEDNSSAYDFTKPQPHSDVVLVVGGVRLHVNKAYLSMHSPFFNSLFYSDFSERSKEEVELGDMRVEDFVELLHVVYPSLKPLSEATVEAVLMLADKFQMQRVVDLCERFLLEHAHTTSLAKKFLLVEQCRLPRLEEWCHSQLRSLDDVRALGSTKEFRHLADKAKVSLLEKGLSFCNKADCRGCYYCGHNSFGSCTLNMHDVVGMEEYSRISDDVKLALLKKALGFRTPIYSPIVDG